MPSADFAAAQARLALRRQQREAEARNRQTQLLADQNAILNRLPFPFRGVGHAGYSVWNTISRREGTQPAFRVGQVDAELLDEELLELLKGQVGEALKYYGAQLSNDYSAEILLALRAILFKLTLWDHDASYGAALQGLRYSDARDKSLARPPPRRWQKAAYGLTTVIGRYGWEKWDQYLIDIDGGFDEVGVVQFPAYGTRILIAQKPNQTIRRLSRFTTILDTTHSVTALISFLTFLYNGTHRTLLDRILRLRLVPKTSHTSREVSFEYLNRQLVWHAFTEFLLFLLPLVGISRWRRMAGRVWRKIKNAVLGVGAGEVEDQGGQGELGFLPERTCAICYADQNPTTGFGEAEAMAASTAGGGGVIGSAQTDITNPYEAVPCGDVYCFVCLAQKIEAEEGEGWTCLRCGDVVKECKPWDGDVVEEAPLSRPAARVGTKSVGFAPTEDEIRSKSERTAPEESMTDVEPRSLDDDDPAELENQALRSVPNSPDTLDHSGHWAREETPDESDSGVASEEPSDDEYSDRSYSDEQSDQEYDEEEEALDLR